MYLRILTKSAYYKNSRFVGNLIQRKKKRKWVHRNVGKKSKAVVVLWGKRYKKMWKKTEMAF